MKKHKVQEYISDDNGRKTKHNGSKPLFLQR